MAESKKSARAPGEILAELAAFEAKHTQTKPLYDAWSQTYDDELVKDLGYTAHVIGANAFAANAPDKSLAIIDVGCGTGLVGQELARRGYSNIDGLDISEGMLAEARNKGLYGKLIAADVTGATPIGDSTYDAAICAGSFGPGHLGPECFAAIIGFVKPGGLVVLFMNRVHYINDDYASHIGRLERDSVWRVDAILTSNYMSTLDRPGRLIIAHRC